MPSNAVMLDGMLHASAVMGILAAVGGFPAYNVALALYGILGLYSRIPRALLSLLVLLAFSIIADIVYLGVFARVEFSVSVLAYGSVMTILNLLLKVRRSSQPRRDAPPALLPTPSQLPLALFAYRCFAELGADAFQGAGDAAPATEEYYGMAGQDANAGSFTGAPPAEPAYQAKEPVPEA